MKAIYRYSILILMAIVITSCTRLGGVGEHISEITITEVETTTEQKTASVFRIAPGIFPGKIHFGIEK